MPGLNLWLDPHEPRLGAEKVFISHAHSDHIGEHREVILSAPTARLMQARLPGRRLERVLAFGETRRFESDGTPFECTLLPAGHIFGSAMLFIEAEGQSLLYTGDFKLRRGLSAEPCEPRAADILIMETTYGRPHYRFPPTEDVMRAVIRFCQEALDNDETAVLLGYSLGKSQELLCSLGDAKLPIALHGTVYKLTQIYEQFGQCFPKYERYDPASARGKVLLCPPSITNSAMLRNLGKTHVAVLTGWAVDANCRYRYQADAAFPLSDHADFADLIELAKRVAPKKVYTLHGFAADFARTLRAQGFDAQALSEDEQMALPFSVEASGSKVQGSKLVSSVPSSPVVENQASTAVSNFRQFAETCVAIGSTSSKLEKVRVLAEYFQRVEPELIAAAATWFTGLPFPASENKVLQLGWAFLRDALCVVGQIDEAGLHQVYLKHSDLGETAFEILQSRAARRAVLSMADVDQFFRQLHAARGPTGKLPLLIQILQRCSPLEAKFLVKIITSDLRIGLKEGLVEEAIAGAFGLPADDVRQANLLLGNIGETAMLARKQELANAAVVPLRPVKFMLASPEQTAAAIYERHCERLAKTLPSSEGEGCRGEGERFPEAVSSAKNASELQESQKACPTLWIEDKYDGVRCQLHKVGQRVALYSRDLKDITATFHELADAARSLPEDVILDGEILAMRGDQVLPFSDLQRRLGRRENDLFMRVEVPIKFVAFDLLWRNGESLLNQPLRERRRLLEALALRPDLFGLARITPARCVEDIEAVFTAARDRNNEGLMVKDPESLYSPGRRGLAWLKLKKAFATLDCVVVGVEYGHGKRNKVLSDYTFAVRDDETGELKSIGKAYSGLTDVEIAELTQHFLKTAIRQHGRYFEVKPEIVLEIAFDLIQPSDRHPSGLAMRFPRILRIRRDKTLTEIDTLSTARSRVK